MIVQRKLRTDNSVLSSSAKWPRARLAWFAPAVAAVLALLALAPPAAAITVTCPVEFCVISGGCSLREAINEINNPDPNSPICQGSDDSITFAPNIQDVYLDSPLPTIRASQDLTIKGNGVRLHGAYFSVDDTNVTFDGVTDGKFGPLDYSTDRSFIQLYDNAVVNIENSVLVGPNTVIPKDGGGITVKASEYSDAEVSITNTTFDNLAAGDGGGAIYGYDRATIVIGPGTVCKDNSAPKGSCVFARNSTVSIEGSVLTANHGPSDGRGGAVAAENSQITISNSQLNGNSVGDSGGSGRGGAIYVDKNSTVTMRDGTICANNTAGGGGCLWNESPKVVMDHVTCKQNRSATGGCVYDDSGSAIALVNSTCSGNSSTEGGCADLARNTKLTAMNSIITGNQAADNGGGIYGKDAEVKMTGSTLAGNTASVGAGMKLEGSSRMTAVNSTFTNEGPFDQPEHGLLFTGRSSVSFISTTFSTAPLTIEGALPGEIRNSILVNSAYCLGNVRDGGHNVQIPAPTGDCATTSIPVVDPQLDPNGLQNNGGPTPTIAVAITSPAINYVPLGFCTDQNGNPLLVDQRGFQRPGHNQPACTVGAYEFSPPPLDCNAAVASAPHVGAVKDMFWPENIEGLSNPFGTLVVTITGITEDYPVRRHSGSICSNAYADGDTAWVRLESRDPGGLLFRIAFEAKDKQNANASCTGEVPVCVQFPGRINEPCVDTGHIYDATQCPKRR